MQVNLRQIEQEDLKQLRDWRNLDELRQFFREYRLLNMVDQQKWFDYITTCSDVEMFGVVVNDSLIGICGLTHISWVNRTSEVSILLAPECQRQGTGAQVLELLAHKAFNEFNLHRLWAEIYAFNTVSVRLFETAGYKREGVLHNHIFKNGTHHDSLIYGLLRDA